MAWFPAEQKFPGSAGGCPTCAGRSEIPVCPPPSRPMFSDPGSFSASLARDAAEFAAPRQPCPKCRPIASAQFLAEVVA